MNKKLLKSFAAAAMSVLAIACAKEQVGPVDGEICEATFDVAVPGGISTKTIADGTTAKELWYQVFDKDGNVIAGLGKTKHESLLSDRQTSVSMQLVKDQTYNIVFWAQSEGQTCYKFDDLSQITVDYAAAKANEESRDAFLAVKNITVNGPINETVEMKRPFAQLNIGTADAAIAAKAGVVIKTSKVEMKGLPNVLNTINGTTDGAVDVTFADNAVPSTEVLSVNGKEYTYLAMNYILAPAEGKEISDVKATFTAEGKAPVSLSAFSVPFQRNYRTNIIGNILTNSADFNVIVVPDFEDGDKVYDLDNINSAGALAALFANGGSGTLTGDIEMGRFIVPEGKNVVLNLNGKTVTLKGNSTGHGAKISGNVTIKGDGYFGDPTGESVGYMFDLYDSAVLNVEGNATYQCGLSCVQMSANSTVNISGGKWIGGSYSGKYWTINKMDSDKATTSVNITGGEFYKFNPAESYTENPVENWVAGGYKSTLVGDYYVVTKEDVTPVADQEGMNTAISGEGTSIDKPITVELPSNTTFTLDNGIANEGDKSRNITFVGDGTQTFDVITKAISAEGGMLNYQRGSSFTFKNMSIKAGEGNFDGVVCDELVFENCTITGKLTLFGKATFVNCVFENTMANQYSIWTWGGTDVKFDKCTFNTNGKAILLYGQATEANPTNLIVTNCTLNDRKNGAAGKAAIEIGNDYNATYNLTISGCVINGFAEGMNTGSKTWANKNSMDAAHLSVTINGVTIQ